MSRVIESLEREQLRRVPAFDSGDRVKVHFQVVEGNRRRTQVFEGTVIKRQGSGARETFTVRKQSFGVGVERTFPVPSPTIERIEVASRGDVRRAKLYYLRGRVGRRARVRERQDLGRDAEAAVEPMSDALGAQSEAAPEHAVEPDEDREADAPPAGEADSEAEAKAVHEETAEAEGGVEETAADAGAGPDSAATPAEGEEAEHAAEESSPEGDGEAEEPAGDSPADDAATPKP